VGKEVVKVKSTYYCLANQAILKKWQKFPPPHHLPTLHFKKKLKIIFKQK